MTDRIQDVLRAAHTARTFSGAAWSTGTADGADSAGVVGELSWGGPPVDADTLWDLASVTKPIVALAVMALVQDGFMTLDDTIGHHLDDYRGTDKERLTVRQLLTHTAGYPAARRTLGRLAVVAVNELLDAIDDRRSSRNGQGAGFRRHRAV